MRCWLKMIKMYSYWCETLAHILSFYAPSAFYINLVINTLFLYYISVYGRQQVNCYVCVPSVTLFHVAVAAHWSADPHRCHVAFAGHRHNTILYPSAGQPGPGILLLAHHFRDSYWCWCAQSLKSAAASKSLLRPYRQTHNKIIIKLIPY